MIVELLSDSTASTDWETKKAIYQDTFRTPEYFGFDPKALEFAGFELVDSQYVPIAPTAEGRLWSNQLQLFLGVQDDQLRYFLPDGALVSTPEEAAKLAQTQVAEAQVKVEAAEQEAAIAYFNRDRENPHESPLPHHPASGSAQGGSVSRSKH